MVVARVVVRKQSLGFRLPKKTIYIYYIINIDITMISGFLKQCRYNLYTIQAGPYLGGSRGSAPRNRLFIVILTLK